MLNPSRHGQRRLRALGLYFSASAILFLGLSGAAMAADGGKVCNPSLSVASVTPSPYFEDDTITINVELGNAGIPGYEYMEINGFGYALDCQKGQTFQNCTSAGHDIDYSGGLSTDCPSRNGGTASLLAQETNVAITTTGGNPIKLGPGATCNVWFDVLVDKFNDNETVASRLRQSAGWPYTVGSTVYQAACFDEDGSAAAPAESSNIALIIRNCGVEIEKQISLDGLTWYNANDPNAPLEQLIDGPVYYQAVVTNTGNALYDENIVITDSVLGLTGPDALSVAGPAPGASITVALPVEASEFSGGMCYTEQAIKNTARVDASCRDDDITDFAEDFAHLLCSGEPSISIDKTTGPSVEGPFSDGPMILSGTPVVWKYVVTNDGDLPLVSVGVVDNMGVTVVCPKSTLAVAESMTCSAAGTAISGDYDNIGTASGETEGGVPVTHEDASSYYGATPAIGIDKTAAPRNYSVPGDEIQYSFIVTNTGNVTLTGVFVSDSKAGAVTCGPWPVGNPAGTLLMGESVPCVAVDPYEVDQAEIDAGEIINVATATGTPPVGPDVMNTDDDKVTAIQRPAIKLVKSADPTTYSVLGEDIQYSFVVTNIGNVTLTGVTVTDDTFAISVTCDTTTLAPGDSTDCAADSVYDITQDDLSAGSVTNTATASGNPPVGDPVTDTDTETITVTGAPGISIVKTVAPTSYSAEGDILVYTFVVSNTGGIDLDFTDYSQAIEDLNLPDDSLISCVWPGAALYLAVGESVTCSITYSVTQDDLDAGVITNVATTRAKGVQLGTPVSDDDDATATSTTSPSLVLLKEISVDGGATWKDAKDVASAPTVVWPHGADYRITVTNDGPLTLTSMMLNDAQLGIVNEPLDDLAPGAFYVLTSLEIDELSVATRCDKSGEFTNSASADGVTGTGTPIMASDSAVLVCVGDPDITILKEVRPVPWPEGAPNDGWSETTTVPVDAPSDAEYRITVTNTGTVDLVDVVVTDDDLDPPVSFLIGDLAQKESVVLYWDSSCDDSALDYSLCALYVPNRCEGPGDPMNTASVVGMSVEAEEGAAVAAAIGVDDDGMVSDSDTATLLCVGEPLIDLQKEISLDNSQWFDADDEANALITQLPDVGGVDVYYRLVVENLSPVDLVDVTVTDGELGLTGANAIMLGTLPAFAEVVIGSGTVTELFQEDRCTHSGTFANTATATGYSAETGSEAISSDAAIMICTGEADILLDKKVGVCIPVEDDDDSSKGKKGGAKDRLQAAGSEDDDIEKGGGGCEMQWFDETPVLQPPQDAWYKITVTNIGTSDLENVVVSDADLQIYNYWVGNLAVGEEVVIDMDDPDVGSMMYWPNRCIGFGEFDNLAVADGNSVEIPYEPVFSSDIATLVCGEAEICVNGEKPKMLAVEYDADDDTLHSQGDSKHVLISPEEVTFPAGPVTIVVYGKKSEYLGTFNGVMPGDELRISLKRQNELSFDIFDGDTLLQKVKFHVSCSLPLNAGDEFGAITVKY